MNETMLREIIAQVLADMPRPAEKKVPIEVSARHVHLSRQDCDALFGAGYQLTGVRELSQPGEFLARERVRLVGPRGELSNVAILGPIRSATQVELAPSDTRLLGLQAPVRLSGDLSGAADILIVAENQFVHARGSAIVAQRHIHMTPAQAAEFGLENGQQANVRVGGARPVIFEQVLVRVSDNYALAMHIDSDEANAVMGDTMEGHIVGASAALPAGLAVESAASAGPVVEGAADCDAKVITGPVARDLCALGKARIVLKPGAIVTPLARDTLRDAGITLIEPQKKGGRA